MRNSRPEAHRRMHREDEESVGRVRGTAIRIEVPGRGLRQPSRSQPFPVHGLLHEDAICIGLGFLPECQGMVAGADVKASSPEGRQPAAQGMIITKTAGHPFHNLLRKVAAFLCHKQSVERTFCSL